VSPPSGQRGGGQCRRAAFRIVAVAVAVAPGGLAASSAAQASEVETARGNYLLSCGGCHGLEGVSNSRLVPDLKDQVGFFLNLPEGRGYLVRLPNVAFSTTTDAALTDLVNYVVFTLGAGSVPKGAAPYTRSEVAQFRRQPLTEVSLVQRRQQMVQTLINDFHASTELRRYGEDGYGNPHQP
jgi:mono/diheme cytochrome c family protein